MASVQQQKGGKNQNRGLVSSVAPPEKSNLFVGIEENSYDAAVQLPQISGQTQTTGGTGYPRSKQKEKRKNDS